LPIKEEEELERETGITRDYQYCGDAKGYLASLLGVVGRQEATSKYSETRLDAHQGANLPS